MENYNEKVGRVLFQLRKQRGLTQKALINYNKTTSPICEESTLRRIEKGRHKVSPKILSMLLDALGVSLPKFIQLLDGKNLTDFNRDFSEIWDLWFQGQYEKGRSQLEILKTKLYCDTTVLSIKQAILLCDSLVQIDIEGDMPGCVNTLHKAICVTLPRVLKNGEIDCKFIAARPLTLNEYRILKLLAVAESRMGHQQICINLLSAICESLQSKKVDVEIRNRLLSDIYYNLSDELIDTEQYIDALDACKKGIQFCKQVNNHRRLPLLYYSKGKALYYLDEGTRAVKAFKQSYHASRVIEGEKAALKTKEMVAEKYKIFI